VRMISRESASVSYRAALFASSARRASSAISASQSITQNSPFSLRLT
jgi:hypothetical protein